MFTIFNIINLVVVLAILFFVFLIFKKFTGKSKPAEQRSAWEKIACSIFVIGRRNVEDAAQSLRTARVMKDEALQEVNDAINNLKKNYRDNLVILKTSYKDLEENKLPRMKDQPGLLEGKARRAKKQYMDSVEKGNPIEAYKSNAKRFLQMKESAIANISKSEKMLEKLDVAINTSQAEYEGNITELEMIRLELQSQVDIPQLELNQSLTRIRSLQDELTSRMSQDRIRVEVDNEINGHGENQAFSSDIDDEFDKL